ncbi:MAG TPA: carboxylesterase family protein, partial [Rhizomicrobium sp.]|nr:carboxylesterase family protein [Rhizomicrobium sp.]
AGHGTEIPYVFGTGTALAASFGITLAPADLAMEHLVHSCWVGFAKTGRPECDGASWPAYTPATDALMELGPMPGPISGFRKAQYQAQEAILKPQ